MAIFNIERLASFNPPLPIYTALIIESGIFRPLNFRAIQDAIIAPLQAAFSALLFFQKTPLQFTRHSI
jgi:hypothetical protein